jgi:hypothetical protein
MNMSISMKIYLNGTIAFNLQIERLFFKLYLILQKYDDDAPINMTKGRNLSDPSQFKG